MTARERWLDILDGPDEPDVETCVAAAAALGPTYATLNINELRDAVIIYMRLNGTPQHYERLQRVADVLERLEDERLDDTVHLPEVECLCALAALGMNTTMSPAEKWAANGDAAREHLRVALDINPDHNLARVLLQQGDRLQHVSGGSA